MERTRFKPRSSFRPTSEYKLLPFRFGPLTEESYILSNDVGEYLVLPRQELIAFVQRRLDPEGPFYRALKSRHFLFDDESRVALDLLALKYRTRAEQYSWFTGLHMFVVTLRCTNTCRYCQASRQPEASPGFDMSVEHAEKALAFTFRSPSQAIKIEFQGGEPLLNFPVIQHIVTRAEELNASRGRYLEFVIATNLARLTDDVLTFCKEHGVYLSTSLDGPKDLHDFQRPLRGGTGSHEKTAEAIQRARAALGPDAVSALMTTTAASLPRVRDIVDEYVRLGFHSIFLRNVRPFGMAAQHDLARECGISEWVEFYKRGLDHILTINAGGYPLREEYTTILLHKILSPVGSRYVDLQSPAGIGIGAVVFNYDGAVYASDESRMLGEMGDHTFRLGRLDADSYESMMTSEALVSPLFETMLEGSPMCSDCPFLPYCGADPVLHWKTQGDMVGHKAYSEFCEKQRQVLSHLVRLLERDAEARQVLLGWV